MYNISSVKILSKLRDNSFNELSLNIYALFNNV